MGRRREEVGREGRLTGERSRRRTVSGIPPAANFDVRRDYPLRRRRQRSAAPPAARLSADARDVASDRAGSRKEVHRRVRRPARLRRFVQARWRSRPRRLFEARDGGRSGGADARAGLRALQASRSRSRRARLASAVPRSSGGGRAGGGPRHFTDANHVRRNGHGLRDGVLPLVLPDPAVRSAGAADRRRSDLLPAQEARRMVVGTVAFRSARACRIRALLFTTRRRSTRAARTIGLRRRSISSTTPPMRICASSAHCSRCGERRAWSTACSIRSRIGPASRATCVARRSRPGISWPKRRRTRRWRSWRGFSAGKRRASGCAEGQGETAGFAIIPSLAK